MVYRWSGLHVELFTGRVVYGWSGLHVEWFTDRVVYR